MRGLSIAFNAAGVVLDHEHEANVVDQRVLDACINEEAREERPDSLD